MSQISCAISCRDDIRSSLIYVSFLTRGWMCRRHAVHEQTEQTIQMLTVGNIGGLTSKLFDVWCVSMLPAFKITDSVDFLLMITTPGWIGWVQGNETNEGASS